MPTRRPVRLVQSEVWLGRAEFDNMISQRGSEPVEFESFELEPVEAAPSPAADTTFMEVRPLTARSPRAATVAPLFSPVAANAEDDGLIRLDDLEPAAAESLNQPSPVKPRRSPRWAAAGVLGLVLVGGAASVPLLTSHGATTRETAGTGAPSSPVTAIPAPEPSDTPRNDAIDAEQLAPVAAPNPPAAAVRSEPAAVPASHPARSDSTSRRTVSSPQPAAQAPPAPASGQQAADEIRLWWSKAAAAYGAGNARWTHSGTHWDPESSPWP